MYSVQVRSLSDTASPWSSLPPQQAPGPRPPTLFATPPNLLLEGEVGVKFRGTITLDLLESKVWIELGRPVALLLTHTHTPLEGKVGIELSCSIAFLSLEGKIGVKLSSAIPSLDLLSWLSG